jgi:hypothetical protein
VRKLEGWEGRHGHRLGYLYVINFERVILEVTWFQVVIVKNGTGRMVSKVEERRILQR